jgi:hypothetical protein
MLFRKQQKANFIFGLLRNVHHKDWVLSTAANHLEIDFILCRNEQDINRPAAPRRHSALSPIDQRYDGLL